MSATRTHPDRILLLGMMGSGKSTVGRELSRRLGWPLLDNDRLVREATGREPAQIDATEGEDALHDAEAAALRAALERPGPAVIGVAGAIVDRPAELALLRHAGHVVWLRARPETLRARIGTGEGRRQDARDPRWLAERAAERAPAYAAAADEVVDVDDLEVEAIVDAIILARGRRLAT